MLIQNVIINAPPIADGKDATAIAVNGMEKFATCMEANINLFSAMSGGRRAFVAQKKNYDPRRYH